MSAHVSITPTHNATPLAVCLTNADGSFVILGIGDAVALHFPGYDAQCLKRVQAVIATLEQAAEELTAKIHKRPADDPSPTGSAVPS